MDGLAINIEPALCLEHGHFALSVDFRSIPEQSSPAYIVAGHHPHGEMVTPGFQQPGMCAAGLLCAQATQGVAQST